MPGVEDMIAQAERSLRNNTHGTPNEITRFYAKRNGEGFLNELWCDMSITFWAFQSGNYMAVCFGTDFALTSAHVERFRKARQFHDGAAGCALGDIVFFRRKDHPIGHVGLVTMVKNGIIHTIEGNTSNAVRRRTHRPGSVVGYGRPRYEAAVAEEDDFMALFHNVNEFKEAVRAVVREEAVKAVKAEVPKVVQEQLDAMYKLAARGETAHDHHPRPDDTHFLDSHRGLSKKIKDAEDHLTNLLQQAIGAQAQPPPQG